MTRRLPHFRKPVFERIAKIQDFDTVFLHTESVPRGDTGITTAPLENSRPVHLVELAGGRLIMQPESLKFVRRHNPDVIVCEANPFILSMHAAGLLQRMRGQAVVYWTKGPSPAKQSHRRRMTSELLFRLWRLPATVMIGYGESSRKWFEQMGVPRDRIVIAQNTIDTRTIFDQLDRLSRLGRDLRNRLGAREHYLIGAVGRLIDLKNVELTIAAAARVRTFLEKPVTLLVAGHGPAEDSLKAVASRHGNISVRFLGRIAEGEDNVVMAACDVNVFAGAVGLGIVQSMALAKPTICADEPFADSELIRHDETGLRFARGSADALVTQLLRVLQDSNLAHRMAEAGQSQIRESASIELMVERIADGIRMALKLRRNAIREV